MTAAEALHTPQRNLSRLIAQLELSTGLKLFKREGIRLIPTKEGSTFFQELERAYVGLDSMRQSAKNIRNLDTGRLHIAAVPSTGLTLIPHVIKDFVEMRPEQTVSLYMNASPTVVQWVPSQFCDLGVVVLPSDAGPKGSHQIAEFSRRELCHPLPLRRYPRADGQGLRTGRCRTQTRRGRPIQLN